MTNTYQKLFEAIHNLAEEVVMMSTGDHGSGVLPSEHMCLYDEASETYICSSLSSVSHKMRLSVFSFTGPEFLASARRTFLQSKWAPPII